MRKPRALLPYFLLLPSLTLMILVFGYPLASGIRLAFYKLYLIRSSIPRFIGWKNFIDVLHDPLFHLSMKNSIYWVGGSIVSHIALGMGTALLMNLRFRGRGIFRGLFLLPWVTPVVVIGIVWRWIYNYQWGLLNGTLVESGIINGPIDWLANPTTLWPSILICNLWKSYGFLYICFLAGLQSVPPQSYEAAVVDGASRWHRFRYITIPALKPITTVSIMLSAAWTFNNFEMIWLLTQGGPGNASMVFGPFVYQASFRFYRFGYASAAGVIGFLIMLGVCIIYLRRIEFD